MMPALVAGIHVFGRLNLDDLGSHVAGVSVSLLALVFGLGILRLRGAFFALATIGVNEATKSFVASRTLIIRRDQRRR